MENKEKKQKGKEFFKTQITDNTISELCNETGIKESDIKSLIY